MYELSSCLTTWPPLKSVESPYRKITYCRKCLSFKKIWPLLHIVKSQMSFIFLQKSHQVNTRCLWNQICGRSNIHTQYLVVKCHSITRPKIFNMVTSSNIVIVMVLKCRRKRGVTGLRPPPGGPIAAMIWISTRWMGLVSLRSYLRISMERQTNMKRK